MTLPAWPLSPTAADLEACVARAREQLAGDGHAVAVVRGEPFASLADRFARALVDLVDGKIDRPRRERFDLVDGKCPVCATPVEIEVDGVRARFTPHDDPDWCRAAARNHAGVLTRALAQVAADREDARRSAAFHRRAYEVAIGLLAGTEPEAPRDYWRERVAAELEEERKLALAREAIAAAQRTARR